MFIKQKNFTPSADEIENINKEINRVSLEKSIQEDKRLIEAYKTPNTLSPEETIKSFISAYHKSTLEAIKYVKPIPDFFRLDYYDVNVLNSFKGTEKEELATNYNKARIYKNHYIYNLVRDIRIKNGFLKLVEEKEGYAIYSLELEYNNLCKGIKDVSELLYLESDTPYLLKFLKENSSRNKKIVNVYVVKDSLLGYRIDFSNKENYNLISVLSGGLSDLTLK